MINVTDQVTLLADGRQLHKAVLLAIARASQILEQEIGRTVGARNYAHYAFITMLRPGTLPKSCRYDAGFVKSAFQVSQGATATISAALEELSHYTTAGTPPAVGISSLRRGLKLLLVELWRDGACLLPTIFTPGPGFPVAHFEHRLLSWVRSFNPEESGTSRRLHWFGPRLLWATSWREPADVSLQEIAHITEARSKYKQGLSSAPIGAGDQLPFVPFAVALLEHFPSEVTFSADDLARYSNWTHYQGTQEVSFQDFEWPPRSKPKPPPRRSPIAREPKVRFEAVNQGTDAHQTILRNFQNLRGHQRHGLDWRVDDDFTYPGREHVELSAIAPLWLECFRAFLRHRVVVKGYRSDEGVFSSLNILADYLFYYLPWWSEISPERKVEVPTAPKNLGRYAFVARHTPAPLEELPMTLLELIRVRRPNNETTKVVVHQVSQFFSFVATHFADREDIAGPGYRSPLNPDFDAPRIETKNKTTKEVIPKQIYGYLLFYCYALEEFGGRLEEMAKAGRLPSNRKELTNALRFYPRDLGCEAPVVTYRGRSHVLDSVPNVFSWSERTLKSDGERPGPSVYLPHLTTLRLLIASVETGLRVQSVQWLDRSSWRKFADEMGSKSSYTYPLLVNTDKTKTSSWRTFVVHRVWDLLKRQEEFQTQFEDADAFGPVDYEGNEASPFDPIRPLFRRQESGYPVTDATYARYWEALMVDFEDFYRRATGERHVRMYKLQPRVLHDGSPVIKNTGLIDPRPYCALSILAIHTPHACRATFATNRKGVLELSDTAELLGHSSTVVTAHYDKPDEEDLRSRLKESDELIVAEFIPKDAMDNSVAIRADKSDSVLAKSFARDREHTVKAFKFMPSIAIWSTKDDGPEGDGLRLLKEGPMSRIRFRETHICPVGEECPADVLQQIGEPKRCGSCPLAMKCIDHLPAISAKRNQLLERIRYLHRRRDQLEQAGEPAPVLDEVWDAIELDVNELLGWQLSEEILDRMRADAPRSGSPSIHVHEPEIVRRHLRRVTRDSNFTELMLQRIVDTSAYPSMSTPQVQLAAKQIKRRLLSAHAAERLDFADEGSLQDIRGVAAMLSLMLQKDGVTMKAVAESLSDPDRVVQPLLTEGVHDATQPK